MKAKLFKMIAICTLILGGCTANGTIAPIPPSYDDDFTMDGGSYHNTPVNFKNVSNSSCEKNPNSTTYTEIMVTGNGDTFTVVQLEVRFNASSTGTYNCDRANNTFVNITITSKNNPNQVQLTSDDGDCSINCTDYGDVGGKVKGKFSGKFTSNGTHYTITNGVFSVKRTS